MDMLMRKTVASGSASRYLPAQRWRPRRKRSRSFAPKLASAKAGTSGRDARSAAQYIGEARSSRSLSPAAGGSPKGRLAASSSAPAATACHGNDPDGDADLGDSGGQRLLVLHSWRIARNSSVREPSRHAGSLGLGKMASSWPNVRAEAERAAPDASRPTHAAEPTEWPTAYPEALHPSRAAAPGSAPPARHGRGCPLGTRRSCGRRPRHI